MFADDVAIITYSKEDTQKFINCLDKICRKFGMEISGTKTEIMHQKKRNDTYPSPKFYLGNHELKLVSNFKYLVQFSLQLLQKMQVTTWKVI